MIILEGADGTGKTTLAKKIVELLPQLEYRRPPEDLLSSTKGPGNALPRWWNEQLKLNDGKGVYDRCYYISEIVYQLAMPSRPLIAMGGQMEEGIFEMWRVEPYMIFCLPQLLTQRAARESGPKLEGLTMDAAEKVAWAYHSLYAMWSNSMMEVVRRYDFESDLPELIVGEIEHHLERRAIQDA